MRGRVAYASAKKNPGDNGSASVETILPRNPAIRSDFKAQTAAVPPPPGSKTVGVSEVSTEVVLTRDVLPTKKG